MRILVVHNGYRFPGGEDRVFRAEVGMLRAHGHSVTTLTTRNEPVSGLASVAAAGGAIWSAAFKRRLGEALRESRPDVAHFHNTFFRISPAGYCACREVRVAVVQTLHNYRLLCPGTTLYRRRGVCEECVGRRVPWPGVRHACYRGSRSQTAVVAAMLAAHRWLGTWQERVHVYVAMSRFARGKFIAGGLPADKILVKPNFVDPDPGLGDGEGGYALFVGRLAREKGVDTLLDAWGALRGKVALKIVGDGPLASQARSRAGSHGCEWLGWQPEERVVELMKKALCLVFPSEGYEGSPMAVIEAYAVGLPVIAGALGGVAEMVHDRQTGLHFRAGDSRDLAAKVEWLLAHRPVVGEMRRAARAEYEAQYTAGANYPLLMRVYQEALAANETTGTPARVVAPWAAL